MLFLAYTCNNNVWSNDAKILESLGRLTILSKQM